MKTETTKKIEQLKNYEIYSENFSQVITAGTLLNAVSQFRREHPEEVVIFAEDIWKRNLNNALSESKQMKWTDEEIKKLALESCPVENLKWLEKYFSPINIIREWERRGFEIGFLKALTLIQSPQKTQTK